MDQKGYSQGSYPEPSGAERPHLPSPQALSTVNSTGIQTSASLLKVTPLAEGAGVG